MNLGGDASATEAAGDGTGGVAFGMPAADCQAAGGQGAVCKAGMGQEAGQVTQQEIGSRKQGGGDPFHERAELLIADCKGPATAFPPPQLEEADHAMETPATVMVMVFVAADAPGPAEGTQPEA